MTEPHVAAPVATKASISWRGADTAVNAVCSAITETFANGETVTGAGFRTFSTKSGSARSGRTPGTGETIIIAASKWPTFKAGKILHDAVKLV